MTAPIKRPRRKPGSVKTIDAKALEELQAGFDKLMRWDEPTTIQLIGLTEPQRDALKAKYKRQWAIWTGQPIPTEEYAHVPLDSWTFWWMQVNALLGLETSKMIDVAQLIPHVATALGRPDLIEIMDLKDSSVTVVSKVFFERQWEVRYPHPPTLRPFTHAGN